jgi:CRISPR-associated protein Cas2
MGWIMVMFDLPVMTDEERKAATHFRKQLLDTGYLMIQFSIYARPCVSYETMDVQTRVLEKVVPAAGNVRVMFFTDQQWQRAYTVVGANYRQGKRSVDPGMPEQVEFWE